MSKHLYVAYALTDEQAAAERVDVPETSAHPILSGRYADFDSCQRNLLRRKAVTGVTYLVLLVVSPDESYPVMTWRIYQRRTL